jgi:hypothetical protein
VRYQTDLKHTDRLCCGVPQSFVAALTGQLETVKALADDLARANGNETLGSRALADAIIREVDDVSRALRRGHALIGRRYNRKRRVAHPTLVQLDARQIGDGLHNR